METDNVGFILVIFLMVAFLVGVGLYLYMKNHHNEYTVSGNYMSVVVKNESTIPYKISLPNGRVVRLAANHAVKLSVAQHDTLSVQGHSFDGDLLSYTYTFSDTRVGTIYLTSSGVRTNLSGNENAEFVNNAHFPVLFIERSSKGGRRWASDIVPPGGMVGSKFVGSRTTWEVVHPTAEDQPISQVTVGGKVSKLIFDGENLIADSF